MQQPTIRWLWGAGVGAILSLSGCVAESGQVIVLDGATIITGTGDPPIQNGRIVVRDRHLDAVGPMDSVPLPPRAEPVDLTGKWVIPGLIDMSVSASEWTLPRFVAWGVTTVRDLATDSSSAYQIRDFGNLGSVVSPRIFVSAGAIDGPDPALGDGAKEVTTEPEARRAVDMVATGGAGWVFTHTHVTPSLLRWIVAEASLLHLPVAAHLGRTDALTAARAGVVTIERLSGVVEATVSNPALLARAHQSFYPGWAAVGQGWTRLSDAGLSRTARALQQIGVAIVPALVWHEAHASLGDTVRLRGLLPVNEIPDSVLAEWGVTELRAATGWSSAQLRILGRARRKQDVFVQEFKKAGGRVITGSAGGATPVPPGLSLHRELELLVRAGLSPAEALLAATGDAAQALRADSLGRITAGRVADLVILDADPLESIANSQRIAMIMLRGQLHVPAELRVTW